MIASNTADPRKEEQQLLRQLGRNTRLASTHSATIAIMDRLVQNGEAMAWPWPEGPGYIFEITATGMREWERLTGQEGDDA